MHNAALSHLGLNFCYVPFAVKPEHLKHAVAAIRSFNIQGVNVTIPHKERILPYLDKVVPPAKAIGAVNTVVNRNGVLTGCNTDVDGFLAPLRIRKFSFHRKSVVLLGAGGAGRACLYAALRSGVKNVFVFNRTESRAERLRSECVRTIVKKGQNVVVCPWREEFIQRSIKQAHLLVHATSVGLNGKGYMDALKGMCFPPHFVVYDLVYVPQKTGLLRDAKQAGARTISGLEMLLEQGAASFKLWTGKNAPLTVMKKTLRQSLSR